MSRGLLIAGGLLGGGALVALAAAHRDALGAAASTAYMSTVVPMYEAELEGAKLAVAAAKTGVIKVTEAAQTLWNKLKLPVVAAQNITRYGLGALIDKYRGPIPKWMVLAIIHTETGGTFDPLIYNYPAGSGLGGVAYAAANAGRYGDGWFAHNPHAIGLLQILQKFLPDYSRYGGFDHTLTVRELLDPEVNLRAGLGNLKIQWAKRIPAAASDDDKLTQLYFAHNQGGPTLGIGLAKTTNKLSARAVIAAAGAGMTGKPLTVALVTARRGALWAQLAALNAVPA